MFALFVSAVIGANAQVATENSRGFDNISIGVTAGVSTPLDFNSVFPLNTNVGIKLQKDFTPVFGIQAEGLAVLNDNHFTDIKTAVKATNVGINGMFNLANIFGGYKGIPRVFEVSTVTGLGWMHTWNTSANYLTAKTGLDLAFNLGKSKATSIVLTPAIYWNLNRPGDIHFDKHNAQFALNLSFIYHFKNSNGTHSFKTWDIGAMTNEIAYLQGCLDECEKRTPEVREVEKVVTVKEQIDAQECWIVAFEFGKSELTNEAKFVLDSIGENSIVDIVATASPEGTAEFNQKLSDMRAARVADYLTNRGIKVNSAIGKGVNPEAGKTAVVVTVK